MSQNDNPQSDKPTARPAWAKSDNQQPDTTPLDTSQSEGNQPESSAEQVGKVSVPPPRVTVEKAASATGLPQQDTPSAQAEADRPLGRDAQAAETATATAATSAAPKTVPTKKPQLSPQERLKRQSWVGLGTRMVGGLLTLGLLLAALGSGLEWPNALFLWVLLTIVADEFGGWFGYIAAFMGLLTLLGFGHQPAENWRIILPLVGGGLLALLVVKHSGGWGVLPFAAAVFALPVIAASQFGELLDPNLLLVADPDLVRSALLAMVVGMGLSLVRQLILWIVDLAGRRTERRLLHADQIAAKQATEGAAQ